MKSLSGSLNYQIVASSSWLGASPMSGTVTTSYSTIVVTANAAALGVGVYNAMLTISCVAPVSCSPIQVPASFAVNAYPPTTLTVSPPAVSFTGFTGRSAPPPKTITVGTNTGFSVDFTVSGVPPWLTVSPLTGATEQSSATLTLTPNASSVPANGASAALTIAEIGGTNPVSVPVAFAFSPFSVNPNPSPLTIGVESGETQIQTLSIGTADGGPAAVTLALSGSSAVSLGSQQITVPGAVNITASGVGLSPGSSPTATITISCLEVNPCAAVSVPVQVNVTAGPSPTITPHGIVPLYSTANTVQAGEWISIFGNNLASGTFTWTGDFPHSLGGTSVTIDGKGGYLSFASPTQINVQVPDDTSTGTVPVVVTTPSSTVSSSVTLAEFAPALSLLGDNKHAAGIIYRNDGSGAQGGGTYDIIGPTGNSLGYATVAAKAGDAIALFGVGFGPTSPSVSAGRPFSGQAPVTNTPTLLIDNLAVPSLLFSGLSGAGIYQFNLVIPSGLGSGNVPIQAMVGGLSTQTGVVIALQ